jgi:carbon storage regulator
MDMLILMRRVGEKVIINDKEVVISVLEIVGEQVRLGIDASEEIVIHREEVYNKINIEKKQEASGLVNKLIDSIKKVVEG